MDGASLASMALLIYTGATASVLVGVSGLLAAIRLPGVWVPIRTWLLMLPVILGAIWLGAGAWTVLVTVVSILAYKEFARATGLYRDLPFVVVVYVAILAENLFAFIQRYDLFMAAPMWAVLVLTLVPILRNRTEGMLQSFALSVVGVVFFAFFPAHLSYLVQSPLGLGYLLFVVLATQLNDALGFIYGRTLGRRRWTSISPNKTLEGSVLAMVTTMALALIQWPIAFPHVPLWGAIAAGVVVGFGGQVGDLTMANVKRNVGIKDFGHLLPGHGGLIDRLNSLMITAPVFAHFMGFLFGGFPVEIPGYQLPSMVR
jgi:phosphatidate cytidylyltransferase